MDWNVLVTDGPVLRISFPAMQYTNHSRWYHEPLSAQQIRSFAMCIVDICAIDSDYNNPLYSVVFHEIIYVRYEIHNVSL